MNGVIDTDSNILNAKDYEVGLARLKRLWNCAQPPYTHERNWDKSDVADILHILKQVTAICVGILLAVFGVTGWIGYAIGIGALTLVSHLFLNTFKIPDMIMTSLVCFQEGFMPALMTLTLFWVVVNTIIQR